MTKDQEAIVALTETIERGLHYFLSRPRPYMENLKAENENLKRELAERESFIANYDHATKIERADREKLLAEAIAKADALERELAEAREQERLAKLCIEEYKKLDRALTDENQALRADAEALQELAVWGASGENRLIERTAWMPESGAWIVSLFDGKKLRGERVEYGTGTTLAAAIMEALAKVSP